MECSSELFTEASGYLSSPEYPQPYPEYLRCNYSIRLQKGLSISLVFLEPFEIDDHQQVHCPYDQLKVLRLANSPPSPAAKPGQQSWGHHDSDKKYGISTSRLTQQKGLSPCLSLSAFNYHSHEVRGSGS